MKEIKGRILRDSHVPTGLLALLHDRSLAAFGQADGKIQMVDIENETTLIYTTTKNRANSPWQNAFQCGHHTFFQRNYTCHIVGTIRDDEMGWNGEIV